MVTVTIQELHVLRSTVMFRGLERLVDDAQKADIQIPAVVDDLVQSARASYLESLLIAGEEIPQSDVERLDDERRSDFEWFRRNFPGIIRALFDVSVH